jgi:hypothetical protein
MNQGKPMSIIKTSIKQATAGAATASELPLLTPEEALELLRGLEQRIPEFVQLPKDRRTRNFRRVARLNPDFAREAFSAVGTSELVQNFIGNTQDELRKAEDEIVGWTAVQNALRALLRGVDATILVRRQRVSLAALQAAAASRQLVQRGEHPELLPHVERMSQLPRYGRRSVKQAAAPQAPPQQPPKTA